MISPASCAFEEGRRRSRHTEVDVATWRDAAGVLPAARDLMGTFPPGSGPNCFGTVMGAAGVDGAAGTWMQREPFQEWLAAASRPGGHDGQPGGCARCGARSSVWAGLVPGLSEDGDVAIDVLSRFFRDASQLPGELSQDAPWRIIGRIGDLVLELLGSLPPGFERISAEVAVHRSAVVASSAVVTGPAIVSAGCRVGHGALLRDGVWAGEEAVIGPHSEIKGSLLLAGSAAAHRNYVGNSIVGAQVNLEAGAVLANHFNERADKQISVMLDGQVIATGLTKFGALVGDGSRVGANAVTSPGTLLPAGSVVPRLGLVDQLGGDGGR